MKPRSELPKDQELFQVTVVFGNFKSRKEAKDFAEVYGDPLTSNVIDVSIKGSWSK